MDVNVFLFDDFETLEAFGPVEILGQLDGFTISYYSIKGGVVYSTQGAPVVTQSFEKTDWKGLLLIPGGKGIHTLIPNSEFIQKLNEAVKKSRYCLAVCTGTALLAKCGAIDNRKAMSSKYNDSWMTEINKKVKWIEHARWVVDGKYYTSSGGIAGIDMTLGFVQDYLSKEKAEEIAQSFEYIWNSDRTRDFFSKIVKIGNALRK